MRTSAVRLLVSGCRSDTTHGVITTYTYDQLNRLTSKSYSDGTPVASFGYDSAAWGGYSLQNTIGRLSQSCTSAAPGNCTGMSTSTAYSYDALGHVTNYWQCTPYNCPSNSFWQTFYSYDLGSDVTSWTHPAGFTLSNTMNSAQEISQITCSANCPANTPTTLATGPDGTINYTPWGALSILTNGCYGTGCTQVQEVHNYNNRLQTVAIVLGTASQEDAYSCLMYNYYPTESLPASCSLPTPAAIDDTGNVVGYTYQDFVNTSYSHAATFTYDALNRLQNAEAWSCASAPTNCSASSTVLYNLPLSYDRYGNMTCVQGKAQGPVPCPSFGFNLNNQISGLTYDAAGNMTNDGTYSYVWDGENRLSSDSGPVTNSYSYNVLGQMVQNSRTSSSHAELPYDIFGHDLGHFSLESGEWWEEYIPFGGTALGFYDQFSSQMRFLHRNVIGSSIFATDGGGNYLEDSQYYPWGGSWEDTGSGSSLWNEQFAGFPWNDGDKMQYLTLFRRYDTSQGRSLTPDPAGLAAVDLTNPQSLNRYAYVLNNPTTLIDPTGLFTNEPLSSPAGSAGYDPFSFLGIPVSGFSWSNTTEIDEWGYEGSESIHDFYTYITEDNGVSVPWYFDDTFNYNVAWGVNEIAQVEDGSLLLMVDSLPQPGSALVFESSPSRVASPPKNPTRTALFWPQPPGARVNYCGPGARGGWPTNNVDVACSQHDACFSGAGLTGLNPLDWTAPAAKACNRTLCDSVGAVKPMDWNEAYAQGGVLGFFGVLGCRR